MKKGLLLFLSITSFLISTAQLSLSPNSRCAGTSFSITITNAQSMSSSSTCSAQGGLTPAGGGIVILSATGFPNLNFGTTSTTATLNIPSNFSPGTYGFSISTCAGTFSCNNCFTVLGNPTNVSLTPAGVSQICSGATNIITCNATGATSYQWKLNGNDINLATSSTYNANVAGTYTCNAINSCGSTISSNSITVSIISSPTNVSVSAAGNTTICSGNAVNLSCTATNATSYQWKLNGNDIPTANSSTYAAVATGTYSCEAINTCGTTLSSNTVSVTVTTTPTSVSVSPAGNQGFCIGGNLQLTCTATNGTTYQWTKDGNDIPGAGNPTYSATTSGVYKCKVANSCGISLSSDSAVVTSESNPSSAAISPNGAVSICQGTSQILTCNSVGAVFYQWFLDGNQINGANSSTYTASQAGNYTCIAYGIYCQVNSSNSTTLSITTNPTPPSLGSSLGTSICLGDTTIISAPQGFSSYLWSNGATSESISVGTSGTYTVTVNSNCGTVASIPLTITVNEPDIPTISQNGSLLTANSPNAISYQWFLDNNPINGAISPTYTALQDGTYSVSVIDANGCAANSGPIEIVIIGIGSLIQNSLDVKLIPNPAVSEINVSTNLVSRHTISLINIYGQFESSFVTEKPVFSIDISPLPSGVYFIRVESAEGVFTKQFIKE